MIPHAAARPTYNALGGIFARGEVDGYDNVGDTTGDTFCDTPDFVEATTVHSADIDFSIFGIYR